MEQSSFDIAAFVLASGIFSSVEFNDPKEVLSELAPTGESSPMSMRTGSLLVEIGVDVSIRLRFVLVPGTVVTLLFDLQSRTLVVEVSFGGFFFIIFQHNHISFIRFFTNKFS